jgi:hypothetical protein
MMGIKREAEYIPAREQKRLRTEAGGEDDDDQYVHWRIDLIRTDFQQQASTRQDIT